MRRGNLLFWVSDPHLSSDSAGGGGKHIQSTISGFQAHGFSVVEVNKNEQHLLSSAGKKSFAFKSRRHQTPIFRDVKWMLKVALNNISHLRRIQKGETSFQGIYVRAVVLDFLGPILWRKCTRGPVFVEFDGCLLDLWESSVCLKFQSLAHFLLRKTLQHCDFVVCYNQANRLSISANWNIDLEKIIIKSQGVDVQEWTFAQRPPKKVEIVKFVYIGGGLSYHRVDWLMKSIENQRLTFELDLFGDGPCFQSVIESLELWDVPNVRYHGPVEHSRVRKIYADADCVIIPGADEYVHPLRLLEALSHGKRVLAPRTKGIQSMNLEGVDFFEPDDSIDLIEKMNELTPLSRLDSKRVAMQIQEQFSHGV